MKLILIATEKNVPSVDLLRVATEKRGIELVLIDPTKLSPQELSQLPSEPYLLYRASVLEQAIHLEKRLILKNTTTFFESYQRSQYYIDNVVSASITHEKEGVSIPKTWFLPLFDKGTIEMVADILDGFPLVIKVAGGSHGVGVIKVDSVSSLFSTLDYLNSTHTQYILRKMIDVRTSERLVVLGKQVIDTIQYQAPKGDFRSNEGSTPNVAKHSSDEAAQNLAIKAVQVLGLEFGGVDILTDTEGNKYVTEVNFPCFFPRCQLLTRTDIAGMMVEYLVEKSRKLG